MATAIRSATPATRRQAGERRFLRHALAAIVLAAAPCLPALAASKPAPAKITILDGEAVLTDGAQRFIAAEGVELRFHTLIETGARSNLLRIEWADGRVLDLGPGTRLMFDPPSTRKRGHPDPAVYVLQGWVKQLSAKGEKSPGQVSPLLDVEPFTGAVVTYVDTERTWLFVEAGQAPLTERGLKSPARFNVRAGAAYARTGDARGATAPRPTAEAMKQVPRAFRDPLPLRFDHYKDRDIQAKPLPTPTYADLQAWLTAEPRVRHGFVRRFDELLRDDAFRGEIDAHMRDHREWHPVLYPPPPPEEKPAGENLRR